MYQFRRIFYLFQTRKMSTIICFNILPQTHGRNFQSGTPHIESDTFVFKQFFDRNGLIAMGSLDGLKD